MINSKNKIRVAIVGVGNCASSLVQGKYYYTLHSGDNIGLKYQTIGGYKVANIEFVTAFDVDSRKVGTDLSQAIFSSPNCTKKFSDVPYMNVTVRKGPVLDGVAKHMKRSFVINNAQRPVDVVNELKKNGVEILICYLPVGSAKATRYYANAALKAKVGFINAIPEFICSNNEWIKRFEEAKLPCAGDDIKSQIGATIIHRVLCRLIQDRGTFIENTYQLNIGGNTDFENMTDENRLLNKRRSKTQAVLSVLNNKQVPHVRIGPSDYVPHLEDNKICYVNIKGKQFGNIPFEIDVKLNVEDSPNSAGIMIDVIRIMKIALNRGIYGHLEEISSYAFKSPKIQYEDHTAQLRLERFIKSYGGQ